MRGVLKTRMVSDCSCAECVLFMYALAKLQKVTASSCISVCPVGKTRPSLGEFSLNLVWEYFSKISREKSSLSKIRQE